MYGIKKCFINRSSVPSASSLHEREPLLKEWEIPTFSGYLWGEMTRGYSLQNGESRYTEKSKKVGTGWRHPPMPSSYLIYKAITSLLMHLYLHLLFSFSLSLTLWLSLFLSLCVSFFFLFHSLFLFIFVLLSLSLSIILYNYF